MNDRHESKIYAIISIGICGLGSAQFDVHYFITHVIIRILSIHGMTWRMHRLFACITFTPFPIQHPIVPIIHVDSATPRCRLKHIRTHRIRHISEVIAKRKYKTKWMAKGRMQKKRMREREREREALKMEEKEDE